MAKIRGVIDPGHGGSDRANRGPTGYIEADGVLDISKRLKQKLESTGAFDIKLTRDRDMTLGLTERAVIADNYNADLFISEHTNAGPASAGGTVVFYSVDLPGNRAFAEELAKEISSTLGISNRGAKTRESTRNPGEDYYTVIDAAQDRGIRNVYLIESAFHSNPAEEKLLLNASKRDAIAEAQARVICRRFNVSYNGAPSTPDAPTPPPPSDVAGANTDNLNLQRTLNRLKIRDNNGNALSEDGIMGPRTREAVRKFQSVVGIPVDGIPGPQTMGAINSILSKPMLRNGSRGTAVRYIQFRVDTAIDGIFGSNTKAAVISFQRNNGLSADGIVGPRTWGKLIG